MDKNDNDKTRPISGQSNSSVGAPLQLASGDVNQKMSQNHRQQSVVEVAELDSKTLANNRPPSDNHNNNNNTQMPTESDCRSHFQRGSICDEQNIDAECERLLRKTKRQVKQMMEEAVTKKFIHEESSSIISLCVAIDACISHGLERRALGLFKTNSSTALIQKVAKSFPIAREVLALVETEEKIKLEQQQQQQQKQQRKRSISSAEHEQGKLALQNHHQQHHVVAYNQQNRSAPIRQASNHSVHKRNMWIKFALIERKLVDIVEYLAENASKYYEPSALMANYLCSQLLCSLLVGPCALEFSRSKTNDYYQFEEPTADELLKRHKLSNPIACLCSSMAPTIPSSSSSSSPAIGHHYSSYQQPNVIKRQQQQQQHNSDDSNQHEQSSSSQHSHSARSATDANSGSLQESHNNNNNNNNDNTTSPPNQKAASVESISCQQSTGGHQTTGQQRQQQQLNRWPQKENCCSNQQHQATRRRRPLALKTNVKTGALVTDCHHYSCQEISEHHQTRGYSFKCSDSNSWSPINLNFAHYSPTNIMGIQNHTSTNNQQQQLCIVGTNQHQHQQQQQQQQQQELVWSAWSPRMLHETLHQNSKSNLLYAKNNVLMETQSHETMPGYLSLHQVNNDLILKWIPNQMINGHAPNGGSLSSLPNDDTTAANDQDNHHHHHHRQHHHSDCCCTTTEKCASLGASRDVLMLNAGCNSSRILVEPKENHPDDERETISQDLPEGGGVGSNGTTGNNRQSQLKQRTASATNELAMQSVGSSYLDLVVNLSLSRIVLLHCQFGAPTCINNNSNQMQQQRRQSISNQNASCEPKADDDCNIDENTGEAAADQYLVAPNQQSNKQSLDSGETNSETITTTTTTNTTTNSDDNTIPQATTDDGDCCLSSSLGATSSSRNEPATNEETLILVEVDGVRRAPFKFPKGGLRWFLSCLEGGLKPNKYLEPAIRAYDGHLDPLAPEWPCDSDNSPSTISEPTTTGGVSRLDIILRRLSSLKRRNLITTTTTTKTTAPSEQANLSSRAPSPTPSLQDRQSVFVPKIPLNYVYRIVSTQQYNQASDWRLQTPPNSAPSVTSASSSGSFALLGNSSKQQHSIACSNEQQQGDPNGGGSQMFRWSLSRLTQFSARYTTSSASSSSMGTGNNVSFPPPTNSGPGDNKRGRNSTAVASIHQATGSTLESCSFADLSNADSPLDDSIGENSEPGCCDGNQEVDRAEPPDPSQIERDNSREFVRVEAKLIDLKKSSSDELMALRNQSIQTLCDTMRRQILARAFYGWLAYCRRTKIIRTHLIKLINTDCCLLESGQTNDLLLLEEAKLSGLTRAKWNELMGDWFGSSQKQQKGAELARLVDLFVYYGGIESDELRVEVWPFLLGQFDYCDDLETRQANDKSIREAYEARRREWIQIEKVVKQRDSEILAANMARVAEKRLADSGTNNNNNKLAKESSETRQPQPPPSSDNDNLQASKMAKVHEESSLNNDNNSPVALVNTKVGERKSSRTLSETSADICTTTKTIESDPMQERASYINSNDDNKGGKQASFSKVMEVAKEGQRGEQLQVTKKSNQFQRRSSTGNGVDLNINKQRPSETQQVQAVGEANKQSDNNKLKSHRQPGRAKQGARRKSSVDCSQVVELVANSKPISVRKRRVRLESTGSVGSDSSITDQFGNNIHRIDKDVQRCDRNFWYFKDVKNLDKLRNVMYSYVWQHLDVGYVQGMCDLAAPFLVIFDDEILAYTCFERLMTKMVANFPHGTAMDQHFESLKYLMQVLDPKLFEVLQNNGDYTHFYFCYRWLLLDFKRELVYEDVYRVWETIWSARHIATEHFVVFMALAMVRYYRDIIIENNMDFTDTIKFFNEMAERHDAKKIIALARDSVVELESLIRA